MSKKSSTFAPVIKTTQSFLYLKIINRLIPYRKKDAEKRPFSYSVLLKPPVFEIISGLFILEQLLTGNHILEHRSVFPFG